MYTEQVTSEPLPPRQFDWGTAKFVGVCGLLLVPLRLLFTWDLYESISHTPFVLRMVQQLLILAAIQYFKPNLGLLKTFLWYVAILVAINMAFWGLTEVLPQSLNLQKFKMLLP